MGLTVRVLVTIGHREGDFVHFNPLTPLTGDVERPVAGSLDTTLRCPSCGRQFAIQVCSLKEAARRRRVLVGLAALALAGVVAIGLFVWFVAIRLDTAIPAILSAFVGGPLLALVPQLVVNAIVYDGIHGPWPYGAKVRHWLRRGTRDHGLATEQIH